MNLEEEKEPQRGKGIQKRGRSSKLEKPQKVGLKNNGTNPQE